MAALPQFSAPQAPDTGEEIQLQSGANNWMTQATARDQAQAQVQSTQLKNQQMQALMPALVAKSHADVASAQNDIASAALQQTLRGSFQSLKPQVVADLAAVEAPENQAATDDGTPDWEDKYHQYESLQQKYGQLNLFPEGKAYYQMIEDAKKNAFQMAMMHSTAQAALDRVNAAAAGRVQLGEEQAQSRQDVAEIGAGARRDVASTTAGARVTASETEAGARVQAAQVSGEAGMNKAQFQEFSKAAEDYENAAVKEPDPDKAAALMARANAFRAKAQGTTQKSGASAGSAKVTVPQFTPDQIKAELARRGLSAASTPAAAPAASP